LGIKIGPLGSGRKDRGRVGLLDAEALSNHRTIERTALFSREMALRYGHYPYVSYRMFGRPEA
jgi:hypothetical protein